MRGKDLAARRDSVRWYDRSGADLDQAGGGRENFENKNHHFFRRGNRHIVKS